MLLGYFTVHGGGGVGTHHSKRLSTPRLAVCEYGGVGAAEDTAHLRKKEGRKKEGRRRNEGRKKEEEGRKRLRCQVSAVDTVKKCIP